MAITTNFTNLKGDSVAIKSVTPNTGAGESNTITLIEQTPAGVEIAGTEVMVTVNGGVRGVTFHSV